MKYFTVIPVLCILSLPLFCSDTQAADGRPCKEDVARFCADVTPGGGRIAKCLKEHENELSAACKARGEEVKSKMKEAIQACQKDAAQFCNDVKPGNGRIFKCLKEHEQELSTECRGTLDQRKKR